jgi:hypothetical protein
MNTNAAGSWPAGSPYPVRYEPRACRFAQSTMEGQSMVKPGGFLFIIVLEAITWIQADE